VNVTVNGRPRALDAGTTVAAAVAELVADRPTSGVAVAVNDDVVPRAAWDATALAAGDRVEVLTAMQGG
jgi:sulfur carrier protein